MLSCSFRSVISSFLSLHAARRARARGTRRVWQFKGGEPAHPGHHLHPCHRHHHQFSIYLDLLVDGTFIFVGQTHDILLHFVTLIRTATVILIAAEMPQPIPNALAIRHAQQDSAAVRWPRLLPALHCRPNLHHLHHRHHYRHHYRPDHHTHRCSHGKVGRRLALENGISPWSHGLAVGRLETRVMLRTFWCAATNEDT